MKLKGTTTYKVAAVLALAAITLAVLMATLSGSPVYAQDEEIYVDKQLGRSNPVVGVGEYITFTILIENRTSFTVTKLPLVDNYNVGVLGYVDATVPPDSVDTGAGQLNWNDLTTIFGDLAPGQQVMVTVGFVAEHPAPAVVNAAAVQDAQSSQGQISGGNDCSGEGESVGGSSPVDKRLIGDIVPEVGRPLTFTINITNSGFTTMTVVPLVENYDPAFLQFSHGVPQPDIVDEVGGELIWSDLTLWAGDIPAHGVVQVTVVFTALAPIDVTSNGASVEGASDWFDNEMGGGADLVPITIIGEGGATPTATTAATATPRQDDNDDDDDDDRSATATPAAAVTGTPIAQATATTAVQELPDTGVGPQSPDPAIWLLALLVAGLPLAGWWLVRRTSNE